MAILDYKGRRILGLLSFVLAAFPSPAPAEPPGGGSAPGPTAALRAEASSRDGFSSALDLSIGAARLALRLSSAPGESPEARIGTTGPFWTAGPVRHSGLARVLADPCADAYLFTGTWRKPLALDFDARGYGAFAGDSVGVWFQDARAPRLGFWAGTAGSEGILAGGAAALSLLPPGGGFESWFAPEVPAPARLLAAGMVWAGYGFPAGRVIAAGAVSEEDRGGRGWAVRAEGEWGRRGFCASGRISSASPGWRGLDGDAADRWELRTDASWAVMPRFRLEGRARIGQDPDCGLDWDALARGSWNGKVWTWGAELGACDSARLPPVRLDPAVWAGYETRTVRASARASWVREGADLTRTEVSAALDLGIPRKPGLRLEGARRWTVEGPNWKASATLEVPTARGAWTARAGTSDW
ncbi:MAG TPA: hypothetical protein P5117_13040, partial [Spirochaetia bacterium]|nr:hypothetical protein [Spirochaetia bacterium]